MANRQIFQHEEDLLLNDECKLLEDDANNKTKMFKLETLKNFIAEFVKDKIKSWEYDSLKTEGKSIIESANEIYATTQKRMVSMEEIDLVTEAGFFVDALAVKELNRKLQADNDWSTYSDNGWTLKYRHITANLISVEASRTSTGNNAAVVGNLVMAGIPFNVAFSQNVQCAMDVSGNIVGNGRARFADNNGLYLYTPGYGNPVTYTAFGIVSVK